MQSVNPNACEEDKLAKKDVNELSAAELYELAKQREVEEQEKERAALAKDIDKVKAEKKKLTADYRKQMRALDAKLQTMTGRKPRRRSGMGRGKITERILEIISERGPVSTKDLRAQLEADGIQAANLSQLLGTLKKNGRIVSPERAVYALAA